MTPIPVATGAAPELAALDALEVALAADEPAEEAPEAAALETLDA